jgi:hypothetical protein
VLSEDELRAVYVDSIIDTFQLQDVSWLTLDVDNQYVNVKYTNGASTTLLLGSIYYGAPVHTEQYGQSSGIIYPIDADGNLVLNATNPNLRAMRVWYNSEAKRINDQRLQIAEIVASIVPSSPLPSTQGHCPSRTPGRRVSRP